MSNEFIINGMEKLEIILITTITMLDILFKDMLQSTVNALHIKFSKGKQFS